METSYKGFTAALSINGTKLKGLFKWIFVPLVFIFTYICMFGNCLNFYVFMLYFGVCTNYQFYDGYTNRPNLMSVLPLSDRKRLIYSYIHAASELIIMIIVFTAVMAVIGLISSGLSADNILGEIRSNFPDNIPVLTTGNMFPIIMALGVYFTMPAMAFIRSKKMWYTAAGTLYVINLIWSIAIQRGINSKSSAKVVNVIRFSSLPHYKIIFTAFCIFTVLEIAAGIIMANKLIKKQN